MRPCVQVFGTVAVSDAQCPCWSTTLRLNKVHLQTESKCAISECSLSSDIVLK